ncbi:MAG: hypothetical protein M5U22_00775 [Thermoleophilia bacterium]|nr:hypothetical protein [Thermoleophilia bacterium]
MDGGESVSPADEPLAHGAGGSASPRRSIDRQHRHVEKTVFRILAIVAILSVVAAAAMNILAAGGDTYVVAGSTAVTAEDGQRAVTPEKPVVDLLPSSVISYEVIARQQVPGQNEHAAEAIYRTLNMNLEALVSITNYARVEAVASEGAARARAEGLLQSYPLRQEEIQVNGVTVARTGYSPDEGALGVVWYRDWYVTLVKTSFAGAIPAQKRSFLHDQSESLVEAIDLFQRTGKQGLTAQPPAEQVGPASGSDDVEGTGDSLPDTVGSN